MITDYITSKRAWLAAGVLILIFTLVYGVSSFRVASLEKKIHAQELIVAAKETEAQMHRDREAELEKQMAARDQVIAAKDTLINANTNKRAELNGMVQTEQERFDAELAAGVDLDSNQLRERICARLAAAKVSAPAYCNR